MAGQLARIAREHGAPATPIGRRLAVVLLLAVGVPAGAAATLSARTDALARKLAAASGLPARIGVIDVDLTGTVRLSNVALGTMFSARALEASVALESLLAGELAADEIRVASPRVALEIDADGDSDLTRVVRRLARRQGGSGDGSSRLRRVVVTEGTLTARIDGVGELEAEDVRLVPDAGGVRVISGRVHVRGGTPRLSGELMLARAAAELALPHARFGRLLAVGGRGAVAIDDRPVLAVRDVAIGRLSTGGPVEARAVLDDDGAAREVSMSVATPFAITLRGERVPLSGLAPLAPRAIDLSVAHASGAVAIRRDGADLRVDVTGTVADARINHAAIAPQPVALDAGIRGTISVSADAIAVRDASIDVGAAHFFATGWLRRGGPLDASLDVALHPARCAALLASLPAELIGPLDGMTMSGTFGGHGRLAVDLAAPLGDGTTLELALDNVCQVSVEPPAGDVGQLLGAAEQVFADGSRARVGRGEPGWVRVHELPSYVVGAFTSAEDARFFDHRGFDIKQIAKSLEIDLRDGQISRGGSTISQQLIKNTFLAQRRSLDRKLQEAVLTWRLESRLTKHQILERYLNIIELGPHVFGLGAAARYWFDEPVGELTMRQAAFLAALTSEPTLMSRHVRHAGGLDPESAARIDLILHAMRTGGVIDADDLDRARAAPMRFADRALRRE
jgi:hypothetical protein